MINKVGQNVSFKANENKNNSSKVATGAVVGTAAGAGAYWAFGRNPVELATLENDKFESALANVPSDKAADKQAVLDLVKGKEAAKNEVVKEYLGTHFATDAVKDVDTLAYIEERTGLKLAKAEELDAKITELGKKTEQFTKDVTEFPASYKKAADEALADAATKKTAFETADAAEKAAKEAATPELKNATQTAKAAAEAAAKKAEDLTKTLEADMKLAKETAEKALNTHNDEIAKLGNIKKIVTEAKDGKIAKTAIEKVAGEVAETKFRADLTAAGEKVAEYLGKTHSAGKAAGFILGGLAVGAAIAHFMTGSKKTEAPKA